jgi:hypothetical protein
MTWAGESSCVAQVRALARPALVFACCALTALGCRKEAGKSREPSAWIVLTPDLQGLGRIEPLVVEPSARSITRVGARLIVEVEPEATVRIRPREGCPVEVESALLGPGERVERSVDDWFGFGSPHVAEGYGATVQLKVHARCDEAKLGRIEWRQVAGPTSPRLEPSAEGRRVELRLPTWEEAHAFWGGVAAPVAAPSVLLGISPRTRGEVTLEAAWQRPGAAPVLRRLSVSAAARARGLPNVAVNSLVPLAGGAWRLDTGDADAAPGAQLGQAGAGNVSPPRNGSAAGAGRVSDSDGVSWFHAGQGGRFALRQGALPPENLRVERLDATPLDCGRAGCHEAIAQSARTSPMTTVLERLLADPDTGRHTAPGESYPACALGCHAVGEPGIDDGGMSGALAAHGIHAADLAGQPWHTVPPAVRRMAGVSCLGCHGPAAIPEPAARWTLLRGEVCATCHDAPPRYGHAVAWQSSAMARAAALRADPKHGEARLGSPSCAGCHTTTGFLRRLGDEAPEAPVALGLTCATCHDPHPAPAPAGPGLFRHVDALPKLLGDRAAEVPEPVRACVACHAPADPEAGVGRQPLGPSQAALWAGRGGFEPTSGAPLTGPAPHWAIAGACVGCHDQGPAGLQRGAGHAFQASSDPNACTCCHESKPVDRTLHERARTLLERLGKGGVAWALEAARRGEGVMQPSHARTSPEVSLETARERAAWNALLVFEDRGASAHNQPYARALLDAAERAFGTTGEVDAR